jgi:hypothetical protein
MNECAVGGWLMSALDSQEQVLTYTNRFVQNDLLRPVYGAKDPARHSCPFIRHESDAATDVTVPDRHVNRGAFATLR